jgi:hypothetical protein
MKNRIVFIKHAKPPLYKKVSQIGMIIGLVIIMVSLNLSSSAIIFKPTSLFWPFITCLGFSIMSFSYVFYYAEDPNNYFVYFFGVIGWLGLKVCLRTVMYYFGHDFDF